MNLTLLLNNNHEQEQNSVNLPSIKLLFPNAFRSVHNSFHIKEYDNRNLNHLPSYISDSSSPIPVDQEQKIKIRNRRKYIEINRDFKCNFPGCTKAYGALNHLNTHVTLKGHGPKRSPQEFKKFKKYMKMVQFNYSMTI